MRPKSTLAKVNNLNNQNFGLLLDGGHICYSERETNGFLLSGTFYS